MRKLSVFLLACLIGCGLRGSEEENCTELDKPPPVPPDTHVLFGDACEIRTSSEVTVDTIQGFSISDREDIVRESAELSASLYTSDSDVKAKLELRNTTDGELITSIETNSTSSEELEKATGFLDRLPTREITLATVLISESGGATAVTKQPELLIHSR